MRLFLLIAIGQFTFLPSKVFGIASFFAKKLLTFSLFLITSTDLCLASTSGKSLINRWIDSTIVLIAIGIILIIILREVSLRNRRKVIMHALILKQEELDEKEANLNKEKRLIQEQINLFDEQNELIHRQAIELEKDRRLLEKTVESRTAELKIAKEKAEESDKLKTAFLENMSHEIRTPMNAIMGFSSLLSLQDTEPKERDKFIARINKNCQMLLRLIDDIMDMSAIQSGQLSLIKNEFPINEALNSVYMMFMKESEELGLTEIKLELEIEKNSKDYIIYSDQVRFKQVLSKLLSNAFKFSEKGTVRFGYHALYDSDFVNEPYMLQFFVEDNGIGIAPEKSEYIFKWFSKIEDDKSKLYRGAGLGLYISSYLVNQMGGKIWFNSRLREGSTFYFTLPYFSTDLNKKRKVTKESAKRKLSPPKYDWRNKTILIAEDEDSNIYYLKEIIKRTGAETLMAKNGTIAVELVNTNSEISLVLMDIMMPETDGYEATRQIKSIRPSLPVIAQTAYSNAREQEKSLEAGCDGYISKPYDPPSLLNLLSNFI
jgi:signal transduction histidine kinase/CheY-like chemotaxis protein